MGTDRPRAFKDLPAQYYSLGEVLLVCLRDADGDDNCLMFDCLPLAQWLDDRTDSLLEHYVV